MRSSRQSPETVVVPVWSARCVAVDELPWVGRIGEDGAGEAPLARLPGRRVGIEYAHDPSGRPHIVAPYRAAAVQPLDRIPACLGRPRQGGFGGEGTLADKETGPTAPIEFVARRRAVGLPPVLSCSTAR